MLLLTQGSLSMKTPYPALPQVHGAQGKIRKIAEPQNVSLLRFLVVVHPAARPDCSSHIKLYLVLAPDVKMGLLQ